METLKGLTLPVVSTVAGLALLAMAAADEVDAFGVRLSLPNLGVRAAAGIFGALLMTSAVCIDAVTRLKTRTPNEPAVRNHSAPALPGRNRGINSSAKLAQKLTTAGIKNITLSRSEYGDTLEQFLAKARHSILIVSISLKTKGAENEIAEVFRRKLETVPHFRIIVSLLDPDSHACGAAAVILHTPIEALRAEIQQMFQDLLALKAGLRGDAMNRLHITRHSVLPNFSGILLDDGHPTAQLQTEAKLYGAPRSSSYGFLMQPPGDFYERHRASYYKVVEDAVPYPCGAPRPILPAPQPR